MTAQRPRIRVLIGVGGNINPERNIAAGLEDLNARAGIDDVATFYWSAPVGRPEQPPYLNGAVAVQTDMAPRAFQFELLRGIEAVCGRIRTDDAFASRPLDLDVAVYGGERIDEPDFRVPDPLILERDFLALPLAELAAEMPLPGMGLTLGQAASRFDGAALRADEAFTETLRARIAK